MRDGSARGQKPWVVFVTSNEMGSRALTLSAETVCRAYKLDPDKVLPVECFDGDPFDYPDAKWFTGDTAATIAGFLKRGFAESGADLVVSCPTGICLSPSIASGVGKVFGGEIVLHTNKKPKYSGLIQRLIAESV